MDEVEDEDDREEEFGLPWVLFPPVFASSKLPVMFLDHKFEDLFLECLKLFKDSSLQDTVKTSMQTKISPLKSCPTSPQILHPDTSTSQAHHASLPILPQPRILSPPHLHSQLPAPPSSAPSPTVTTITGMQPMGQQIVT